MPGPSIISVWWSVYLVAGAAAFGASTGFTAGAAGAVGVVVPVVTAAAPVLASAAFGAAAAGAVGAATFGASAGLAAGVVAVVAVVAAGAAAFGASTAFAAGAAAGAAGLASWANAGTARPRARAAAMMVVFIWQVFPLLSVRPFRCFAGCGLRRSSSPELGRRLARFVGGQPWRLRSRIEKEVFPVSMASMKRFDWGGGVRKPCVAASEHLR